MPTLFLGVLTYAALCLLTGLCGSRRRLGFLGTTMLAFFITPVLVMLVLVFTAPKPEVL